MVEGITVLLVSINRAYKTQAGIRIAQYLDIAFAPGPLPQPEPRR